MNSKEWTSRRKRELIFFIEASATHMYNMASEQKGGQYLLKTHGTNCSLSQKYFFVIITHSTNL